ncbi:dihydrofolate reductase [Treponema pedis]|uniref:dihydrofolate reductase n=1 Tax=Treponema pedis TaxID=409322 RepID=UPI00040D89E0|nr:dihydrofolate reductase [Treponema pedis]
MIALIAARSKNNVIGKNGRLPWNIPEDLKRFKKLTDGNTVIMGRKTFEDIGAPLVNRFNIVLSRTKKIKTENCITAENFSEALKKAASSDVFIIGGEAVFREALPIIDIMYITEIDAEYSGDTYFPQFELTEFERTEGHKIDTPVPYRYVTYIKKIKIL